MISKFDLSSIIFSNIIASFGAWDWIGVGGSIYKLCWRKIEEILSNLKVKDEIPMKKLLHSNPKMVGSEEISFCHV